MIQKLDFQSPDFTAKHIEKIAALFPNCVTQVQDESGNLKRVIDFDLLKQELNSDIVEGTKERYRLEWPGKRAALVAANTPISKTLRPAKEESVNFDTTKNLYVEGDNLEALKLLQESYLGAVKMIYIDPPYNTGKDFVYKDNFAKSREEELQESGQIDEEGGRLVANLESNGRFHSDWLSMMYPRLRLARNLLRDDGVIFISIDDNEVHNLRKICDEIFGEGNFITQFAWRRTDNQANIGSIARVKEYILSYSRDKTKFSFNKMPLSDKAKSEYVYSDELGKFRRKNIIDKSRGKKQYEIIAPNGDVLTGPWMIEQDEFYKLNKEGKIYWANQKMPYGKKYLHESEGQIISDWLTKDFGTNQRASTEIFELFGSRSFDFSKPTTLIQTLIHIATNKDDIILDFFSGSATTAHAVMQLNAEDGGNRRFILVQLPEPTDEKSEAYKAGYKTIAEIGKERIRRAGKKIMENVKLKIENEKENSKFKIQHSKLDIGFRVLKVDSSNFKDIYFNPDSIDKSSLFDTVEHIKEDRTPLDLLFGVLVDWGVDLSLPIKSKTVMGKEIFIVGYNDLIACFEDELDIEFIKELAKEDALRVVFKESSFKDDATKINTEQIFKQLAPNTDVRVI